MTGIRLWTTAVTAFGVVVRISRFPLRCHWRPSSDPKSRELFAFALERQRKLPAFNSVLACDRTSRRFSSPIELMVVVILIIELISLFRGEPLEETISYTRVQKALLHRFGKTPDVSSNCEGHAAHIARNTMCAGMLPIARSLVTTPLALKAEPGVNCALLSQLASVRAPWGCKRRRLDLCSQH